MNRRIRTATGIFLSVLLLWWALRDVSVGEVLDRLRTADPLFFTGAMLVALSGFWIRAVRWGLLLMPLESRMPLRPRVAATFIGFAANNVLPARIGEFARAFTLSRLSTVSISGAIATLVIERLFDAIVLVGLLFAAMAAPGFPTGGQVGGVDLRSAAGLIAIGMAVIMLGLFFAVAAPRRAGRAAHSGSRLLPIRFQTPTLDAMRGFARGLAVLRSPVLFVGSMLLALGQWTFLGLSFWLGFRAFAIDGVPFSGAIFLQSLISLAVAIPSSPGFFGPFEAAARVGLGLWGVPAQQAISFAIGYHIGGFIPVTLIGGYYVWRMNIRWSEVRKSERVAEEVAIAGLDRPDVGGELPRRDR